MILGSLFSGSGGFELAGKIVGIEPRWNAEIEPYPSKSHSNQIPRYPQSWRCDKKRKLMLWTHKIRIREV